MALGTILGLVLTVVGMVCGLIGYIWKLEIGKAILEMDAKIAEVKAKADQTKQEVDMMQAVLRSHADMFQATGRTDVRLTHLEEAVKNLSRVPEDMAEVKEGQRFMRDSLKELSQTLDRAIHLRSGS